MLLDVNYGSVGVSSSFKENWDSSINWDDDDNNEMSIKDAMSILIKRNKWHRDNHVPNKYEKVNPTEFGKAIEVTGKLLNN